MSKHEIDAFTAERIMDAAAQGEMVEGFEDLGELLTAFHEPELASEAVASLPAAAVTPPASSRAIGRLTRRTAVAASAAFFALSGVAAALTGGASLLNPIFGSDDPAATDDETPAGIPAEEPEDTVFNFGYDEGLHLFAWNTSATDGQYDCTLENGPVNPVYTTDDGSIVVDALTSEIEGQEMDVTFPDRVDDTADPLPYSADGDCALNVAEVAGPNGQINHGMFMKLFNSRYEGTGRGCLSRYLARSDLGKADQQINVNDVDPDFEPVMDDDSGEIVFTTFTADCERGNNGNASGNDPEAGSNERGRPDSPGRSGDAPGHNK